MAFKERVFSGMQPTGSLHLGNYLGAMVNWIEMQKTHECIYCVVDMHAITVWQDPAELKQAIRQVTAAYIASGLDPKKSILFNQSQVPEHAELAWVFNCVARLGWLNRMTQFKEKAGKDRENASVGLYVYPNLMAADILAYRATHVPVGDDQKQHLELARDIAQKFNNDFRGVDRGGRLRGRAVLSAAGAGDHRTGDARHEPARRHQEDVEVRALRHVAHQPDGRRRRHRRQDQARQDRHGACAAQAASRNSRRGPRSTTSSASMRRWPGITKEAGLDLLISTAGEGPSIFTGLKRALTEVAVEKLGPIAAESSASWTTRPRSTVSSPTGRGVPAPSRRRSWTR